jgi:hypothetical protein
MDDKKLRAFYDKHIAKGYIYRIVAEEHVPRIKKHGFEPGRSPFTKMKKDIDSLFCIVLALHEKGFMMMRWWGSPVDQTKIVGVTRKDLTRHYVDFTPAPRIEYYKKLSGGALANTIFLFTEELLLKQIPLTPKEKKLVVRLNAWSIEKVRQRNHVIWVRTASLYLEHAEFQVFDGKPNRVSPFGSFAQFKRAVAKEGFAFYEERLTDKKPYYLRTTKPIPASEIVKIV